MSGRLFIARHGETVFNAGGRIQGEALHTPLTRAGFTQADAMGAALRDALGPRPKLVLWSSPAGRALQTLAIVAEHLELDWHCTKVDARLSEIAMGDWSGRLYKDIVAELGPFFDSATSIFTRTAPGGERYDEVAARLSTWQREQAGEDGDRLIIMHGFSSRVLRGLLTGAPPHPRSGVPMAERVPQGSIVMIEDGRETLLYGGGGTAPA